jgi:hypothetical protein
MNSPNPHNSEVGTFYHPRVTEEAIKELRDAGSCQKPQVVWVGAPCLSYCTVQYFNMVLSHSSTKLIDPHSNRYISLTSVTASSSTVPGIRKALCTNEEMIEEMNE